MNSNLKSVSLEIAKIFLFFILFYVVVLYLWFQVQYVYNYMLSQLMMKLFTSYFSFEMLSLKTDGLDMKYMLADAKTIFNELKEPIHFKWQLQINLAEITYNIPMTLSAVIALIVVKSRKKLDYLLIIHVILMLIALHFITIYFMALDFLTTITSKFATMQVYLKEHTMMLNDYGYIETFLRGYGIRFEPFLMMVYVWGRIGHGRE